MATNAALGERRLRSESGEVLGGLRRVVLALVQVDFFGWEDDVADVKVASGSFEIR